MRTKLAALATALTLAGATPAEAWHEAGHVAIALDALAIVPERLQEALKPHAAALLGGVVEPDVNRVDDHQLDLVDVRRPGVLAIPCGRGADAAFARLATEAERLLRTGGVTDAAVLALGQATHFVQDVNMPLHAACGESAAEHQALEARMLNLTWRQSPRAAPFLLLGPYACSARAIARRSGARARDLLSGDDEAVRRVTASAWDRAVADTANFWQTVFWRAFGAERAGTYGIPAPIAEIYTGRC